MSVASPHTEKEGLETFHLSFVDDDASSSGDDDDGGVAAEQVDTGRSEGEKSMEQALVTTQEELREAYAQIAQQAEDHASELEAVNQKYADVSRKEAELQGIIMELMAKHEEMVQAAASKDIVSDQELVSQLQQSTRELARARECIASLEAQLEYGECEHKGVEGDGASLMQVPDARAAAAAAAADVEVRHRADITQLEAKHAQMMSKERRRVEALQQQVRDAEGKARECAELRAQMASMAAEHRKVRQGQPRSVTELQDKLAAAKATLSKRQTVMTRQRGTIAELRATLTGMEEELARNRKQLEQLRAQETEWVKAMVQETQGGAGAGAGAGRANTHTTRGGQSEDGLHAHSSGFSRTQATSLMAESMPFRYAT